MIAKDVASAFEEIAPISLGLPGDRQNQVLGFRFGDPNAEVKGVGVTWYLCLDTIQQAVDEGLNFILAHEPGLYFRCGLSNWHSAGVEETDPANLKRKKLLLENDIVVYTAHSNWDLQPEVGMQPTFAKALGLTKEIARDVAVGVYAVPSITFGKLISMVKAATGVKLLRVWGDRERTIKSVALGFGGINRIVEAAVIHGADAGITGVLDEFQFIHARECDIPVIEATHVVSESIGFKSVVPELKKKLPNLRIEFLEVPFSYDWA